MASEEPEPAQVPKGEVCPPKSAFPAIDRGCLVQMVPAILGLILLWAGIGLANRAIEKVGEYPSYAPFILIGVIILAAVMIFYGVSLIMRCRPM